ncbi:hypothetical protein FQA47_001026 [Oryzias melastigma]|uniref:Uncharacterized protein n=1 Tax=Oryzias melastigma TaxID=30732 RepID=A0A834FNA3_ORYME|nr:hypothetical protein FQA47_001026 [Oryzias melastigma]
MIFSLLHGIQKHQEVKDGGDACENSDRSCSVGPNHSIIQNPTQSEPQPCFQYPKVPAEFMKLPSKIRDHPADGSSSEPSVVLCLTSGLDSGDPGLNMSSQFEPSVDAQLTRTGRVSALAEASWGGVSRESAESNSHLLMFIKCIIM